MASPFGKDVAMTIGKVASTQTRPNIHPAAPGTPKPKAGETQQSAKVGWGAGAKATALKITYAAIDEGPTTNKTIAAPKGFKAELKTDSQRLKDKVHGKEVTWESDVSHLVLSGPGGKKTDALKEASADYAADWKAEVAAAKKEPANEYMMLDWSYGHHLSSVGTAGKMMSVQQNYNDYMGGAHPNHGTSTTTLDATTGKSVTLDSLLTQQQMNSLVNDIARRLDGMKGPDGIGPEAFSFNGDKAALRDTINKNFALVTDKSGKVKIDIAWDSGVHALGGTMAHFQLDAPSDQHFRSRIGLD
jgi:hypothetical protein